MSDAVRDHVRKILETIAAENAAEDNRIAYLEEGGHRIVDGGQTGDYDDDNECDWEITDWRTGGVLAAGHGPAEDYGTAWDRLDPDGKFFHIDRVNDMPMAVPATPGVPPTLAEVLEQWVETSNTPSEELAEVAEWTVERVEESRR